MGGAELALAPLGNPPAMGSLDILRTRRSRLDREQVESPKDGWYIAVAHASSSAFHLESDIMPRPWLLAILTTLLAAPFFAAGQEPKAEPKAAEKEKEKAAEKEKPKEIEDEKPVVTRHEAKIGDKALKYTATAGFMPLRDAEGKTRGADLLRRLHGRRRGRHVEASADVLVQRRAGLVVGLAPPRGARAEAGHHARGSRRSRPPPFRLVENGESWLDKTDLVFIDPVEHRL